jgi:GNAT superfamily N-acetyltransferase
MGGNGCPPCVAWRANELPKLRAAEEFKGTPACWVTQLYVAPSHVGQGIGLGHLYELVRLS